MWLVPCKRQEMLTQGSAPDSTCKLIFSSFLTLLHLLDGLICTSNAMSIVLLLQMMRGWDRWEVVDLCCGVGEGTGDRYHLIIFFFVLCFCSLVPHVLKLASI